MAHPFPDASVGSENGEAGLAARLLPLDRELFDLRAGRSTSAPRHERLDQVVFTFEHRLHRSVGHVRDPALDALRTSSITSLGAEENALDAAFRPDVRSCRPAVSRQSLPLRRAAQIGRGPT